MISSSDEETESDDAGLRSHKPFKTVSVARLLGSIRDILGGQFSMPKQKGIVVVPSSPKASPLTIFGSPLVDHGSGSMSGVLRVHLKIPVNVGSLL